MRERENNTVLRALFRPYFWPFVSWEDQFLLLFSNSYLPSSFMGERVFFPSRKCTLEGVIYLGAYCLPIVLILMLYSSQTTTDKTVTHPRPPDPTVSNSPRGTVAPPPPSQPQHRRPKTRTGHDPEPQPPEAPDPPGHSQITHPQPRPKDQQEKQPTIPNPIPAPSPNRHVPQSSRRIQPSPTLRIHRPRHPHARRAPTTPPDRQTSKKHQR